MENAPRSHEDIQALIQKIQTKKEELILESNDKGVGLGESGYFDSEIYDGGGGKSKYEGYVTSIAANDEVDDEDEDMGFSQKRPGLGAPVALLNDVAQSDKDYDPFADRRRSTIANREDEYHQKRRMMVLSPERNDPFADGGKAPDFSARGYTQIMKEQLLKGQEKELHKKILEKVKGGRPKLTCGEAKSTLKKRTRWDQTVEETFLPSKEKKKFESRSDSDSTNSDDNHKYKKKDVKKSDSSSSSDACSHKKKAKKMLVSDSDSDSEENNERIKKRSVDREDNRKSKNGHKKKRDVSEDSSSSKDGRHPKSNVFNDHAYRRGGSKERQDVTSTSKIDYGNGRSYRKEGSGSKDQTFYNEKSHTKVSADNKSERLGGKRDKAGDSSYNTNRKSRLERNMSRDDYRDRSRDNKKDRSRSTERRFNSDRHYSRHDDKRRSNEESDGSYKKRKM